MAAGLPLHGPEAGPAVGEIVFDDDVEAVPAIEGNVDLLGGLQVAGQALGVRADDVALVAVPCFTVFGASVVVGGIAAGSALVLEERFQATEAVELLERERVTLCHGAPTLFQLLLREPGFSRERLPLASAGPAILWYSWLACALGVSLVLTVLTPRSLAERMGRGWIWIVPTALLILIFVYERRWFY